MRCFRSLNAWDSVTPGTQNATSPSVKQRKGLLYLDINACAPWGNTAQCCKHGDYCVGSSAYSEIPSEKNILEANKRAGGSP